MNTMMLCGLQRPDRSYNKNNDDAAGMDTQLGASNSRLPSSNPFGPSTAAVSNNASYGAAQASRAMPPAPPTSGTAPLPVNGAVAPSYYAMSPRYERNKNVVLWSALAIIAVAVIVIIWVVYIMKKPKKDNEEKLSANVGVPIAAGKYRFKWKDSSFYLGQKAGSPETLALVSKDNAKTWTYAPNSALVGSPECGTLLSGDRVLVLKAKTGGDVAFQQCPVISNLVFITEQESKVTDKCTYTKWTVARPETMWDKPVTEGRYTIANVHYDVALLGVTPTGDATEGQIALTTNLANDVSNQWVAETIQ